MKYALSEILQQVLHASVLATGISQFAVWIGQRKSGPFTVRILMSRLFERHQ